ncbi:MAG: hypothetical protein HOE90_21285 [Bacteriovoracaceae bacterium]|jgi:hypothetical protein|nr:hypothetical protein [Bacteriovoracaceae bacterium]
MTKSIQFSSRILQNLTLWLVFLSVVIVPYWSMPFASHFAKHHNFKAIWILVPFLIINCLLFYLIKKAIVASGSLFTITLDVFDLKIFFAIFCVGLALQLPYMALDLPYSGDEAVHIDKAFKMSKCVQLILSEFWPFILFFIFVILGVLKIFKTNLKNLGLAILVLGFVLFITSGWIFMDLHWKRYPPLLVIFEFIFANALIFTEQSQIFHRLPITLLWLLTCFTFYYSMRSREIKKEISFLVSTVFLLIPVYFYHGAIVLIEPLLFFEVSAAILIISSKIQDKQKIHFLVLLNLLVGLSKEISPFLIFPNILMVFHLMGLKNILQKKKVFLHATKLSLISISTMAIYYFYRIYSQIFNPKAMTVYARPYKFAPLNFLDPLQYRSLYEFFKIQTTLPIMVLSLLGIAFLIKNRKKDNRNLVLIFWTITFSSLLFILFGGDASKYYGYSRFHGLIFLPIILIGLMGMAEVAQKYQSKWVTPIMVVLGIFLFMKTPKIDERNSWGTPLYQNYGESYLDIEGLVKYSNKIGAKSIAYFELQLPLWFYKTMAKFPLSIEINNTLNKSLNLKSYDYFVHAQKESDICQKLSKKEFSHIKLIKNFDSLKNGACLLLFKNLNGNSIEIEKKYHRWKASSGNMAIGIDPQKIAKIKQELYFWRKTEPAL